MRPRQRRCGRAPSRASGAARRHRRRRLCRQQAARARLRAADGKLAITLVEARRTYTAPPLSNGVLGGLRDLSDQQFGYDKIAAAGIGVVFATATGVDPQARTVTLSTGDTLPYDKLVIAPGIELRWDALPGYSEAAANASAACLDDGCRAV